MASSLSSLSDEQLQVYKDLLSKKQGDTPQEKPKPPESTFSKLKGAIYDPTIGSIGQGARDLFTPGSRLKGAHEMITGAEKTAIPLGVAAAVANPEVTLPAMALGAAGEAAGKYIPKMFGASEDVSNLTGDIAGLAAGGLGAKAGPRISSAAKVAFPDVAAGAAKAGAGLATGAAMHGMGVPGSDFSTALLTRPGLRQAGKGLVEGAKELVNYGKTKSPEGIVAPPGKGPSIGQLKTAVKNGTITTDQFNAAVDKMTDLNPEAKELHKADAINSSKPDKSLGPVESPKTLNIGQLERLVKIGRLQPEEFNNRLITELKYKPEDAEHLTELLKQSIEDTEKEETEKPEKKSEKKIGEVKSPKTNPELKSPLSEEELQKRIDSHLGEVKSPLEKQVIEPNLKPLTGEMVKDDTSTLKGRYEKYKTGGGVTNFTPEELNTSRFKQFEFPTKTITVSPEQTQIGEVQRPGSEAFLETEPPYKPPITQEQIEESQSTARAAKETTLARHFADKTKFPELPKESEGTAEYLRAVGKDSGLQREPSRRTFENALKRARELREPKK